MKRPFKIILVVLFYALFLASCTIEKRHYQTGYFIDWMKGSRSFAHVQKTSNNSSIASCDQENNNILSAATNVDSTIDNQQPADKMVTASSSNEFTPSILRTINGIDQTIAISSPAKMNTWSLIKAAKKYKKESKSQHGNTPLVLLIILCIILPPLAVGLMTDWDTTSVFSSIAWTLLTCWVGGIIHAFYIMDKYRN